MKLHSKIVTGLLAISAVALSISVQAAPPRGMQGMGCDDMSGMGMQRGMHMDPAARAEQHLSQFKSQLKITPQQEPLWAAFADKVKAKAGEGAKAMRDSMQQPMTAPERMDKMTAVMKERLASMESTHESFKRLYDSMTPEQKALADKHVVGAGMMAPAGKPQGGKGMAPAQSRS